MYASRALNPDDIILYHNSIDIIRLVGNETNKLKPTQNYLFIKIWSKTGIP